MDLVIPRQCDAKAHYGQCKQTGKYQRQNHWFCSHHYTRLKKRGYIRVMGFRGFVKWEEEIKQ